MNEIYIFCGWLIWKWSIFSIFLWSIICILMGLVITTNHKDWGYITASYRGVLKVGLFMGLVFGLIAGPAIGLVEREACQKGAKGPAESLWGMWQ